MIRRLSDVLVIVVGFATGLLLASLDHVLSPAHVRSGPGSWVVLFVDWLAPPLAGTLFAGALLYAQRARRLHLAEKAAAQVLAERLAGTERRQAIWVVAAAVAHDLKNPLHNLQLLVEDLAEEGDAEQRARIVARLRENVRRATERLAELSRAGQRPHDTVEQKVDLSLMLDELAERLRPAALASAAALEVDCPRGLSVLGDAHAVRTAVENVAANALEALQHRGGSGRLVLHAGRRADRVELTVEDDGPGVAEHVRARLFTPFSSGHEGTGLGLAIARALARSGGGDLVLADSAPGRTRFRFTFLPG